MTNKPMLSVELRALLERVATEANYTLGFTSASNYDECRAAVDELRALLDKPVQAPTADLLLASAHSYVKVAGETQNIARHLQSRIERYFDGDPVSQQEGEPIYQVMYRGDGGGGWCDAEKDSYDMKAPHPKHWQTRIVYAEQPAPVAVVLPDNLVSHRDSWLQAMERLVELEPSTLAPDEDDKAFWEHELSAMRDMYADFDRLNGVKP